jgi:hypothetical protein
MEQLGVAATLATFILFIDLKTHSIGRQAHKVRQQLTRLQNRRGPVLKDTTETSYEVLIFIELTLKMGTEAELLV